MAVTLSAFAPVALHSQENSWYSFMLEPTDVSEERIPYIRRVEISQARNQPTGMSSHLLFFCPEDGGDNFLRNVCSHTDYTVLYPR
jgi:hypothetical protein